MYQGIGWVYRYIEQLAKCYYDKKSLEIAVIRTSNIYGPYDRFDNDKSHVIPALIKRASETNKQLVVWGNGQEVRDFIYVDDLIKAILKMVNYPLDAEPINVSNGIPVKICELVQVILSETGNSFDVIYDIDKPTSIPYRVLDNTKYESIYGTFKRIPLSKVYPKLLNGLILNTLENNCKYLI